MLAQRGLRLILDFVPNHVAPDHPWVFEHPEYFVQGTREDLAQAPGAFFEAGGTVIAHPGGPYFSAGLGISAPPGFTAPMYPAVGAALDYIVGRLARGDCPLPAAPSTERLY